MDRQQCDDELYQLMINSCYSQTSLDRDNCLYWARTYFVGVSSYSQMVGSQIDKTIDCCKATVKLTPEGRRNFNTIGLQE